MSNNQSYEIFWITKKQIKIKCNFFPQMNLLPLGSCFQEVSSYFILTGDMVLEKEKYLAPSNKLELL